MEILILTSTERNRTKEPEPGRRMEEAVRAMGPIGTTVGPGAQAQDPVGALAPVRAVLQMGSAEASVLGSDPVRAPGLDTDPAPAEVELPAADMEREPEADKRTGHRPVQRSETITVDVSYICTCELSVLYLLPLMI